MYFGHFLEFKTIFANEPNSWKVFQKHYEELFGNAAQNGWQTSPKAKYQRETDSEQVL
ncbi:9378_t:CDS:2 [Diversispora eburnea]|uniref:9378_t:CDS:1 n=1 Tax=Diversispora eburnea TaxID=1213867 RepID=A0A9N8YNT2_9GLOM|nr:9378_t:CDS:2 [Diversispora eburnea]